MDIIQQLLANNQRWAAEMISRDPLFFQRLVAQQQPKYLWIGCSDSRVPANEVVGLRPGELFVHRNVANMVVHTDMNLLSVLQFAVDILQINNIIVCGHYRCSGVRAAVENQQIGLVDNWLRNIRDLYTRHRTALATLPDQQSVLNRMCELNVIEQAGNVARTTLLQNAWARGQDVKIYGWIYGVENGILKDLHVCNDCLMKVPSVYRVSEECFSCKKRNPPFHIVPIN